MQKMKCIICGKEFYSSGNDADPVSIDGRCCDRCYTEYVVPARIDRMNAGKPAMKAAEREVTA